MVLEVQYDPQVIQLNARRLYREAELATVFSALIGAFVGTIGGAIVGHLVGGVLGLALGVLLGYAIGRQRALALELQAQLTLCQAHIAEQTESTNRRVFMIMHALSKSGV